MCSVYISRTHIRILRALSTCTQKQAKTLHDSIFPTSTLWGVTAKCRTRQNACTYCNFSATERTSSVARSTSSVSATGSVRGVVPAYQQHRKHKRAVMILTCLTIGISVSTVPTELLVFGVVDSFCLLYCYFFNNIFNFFAYLICDKAFRKNVRDLFRTWWTRCSKRLQKK